MRFEKYLQEKYVGMSKSTYSNNKGMKYSIYANPTSLELKMALEESKYKELRFLADNLNKIVFVWPADLIHCEVWETFIQPKYGKGRSSYFDAMTIDDILTGTAKLSGGKAIMTKSDEADVDIDEWYATIDGIDWKWADKYVKITPWLKKNIKGY